MSHPVCLRSTDFTSVLTKSRPCSSSGLLCDDITPPRGRIHRWGAAAGVTMRGAASARPWGSRGAPALPPVRGWGARGAPRRAWAWAWPARPEPSRPSPALASTPAAAAAGEMIYEEEAALICSWKRWSHRGLEPWGWHEPPAPCRGPTNKSCSTPGSRQHCSPEPRRRDGSGGERGPPGTRLVPRPCRCFVPGPRGSSARRAHGNRGCGRAEEGAGGSSSSSLAPLCAERRLGEGRPSEPPPLQDARERGGRSRRVVSNQWVENM